MSFIFAKISSTGYIYLLYFIDIRASAVQAGGRLGRTSVAANCCMVYLAHNLQRWFIWQPEGRAGGPSLFHNNACVYYQNY